MTTVWAEVKHMNKLTSLTLKISLSFFFVQKVLFGLDVPCSICAAQHDSPSSDQHLSHSNDYPRALSESKCVVFLPTDSCSQAYASRVIASARPCRKDTRLSPNTLQTLVSAEPRAARAISLFVQPIGKHSAGRTGSPVRTPVPRFLMRGSRLT